MDLNIRNFPDELAKWLRGEANEADKSVRAYVIEAFEVMRDGTCKVSLTIPSPSVQDSPVEAVESEKLESIKKSKSKGKQGVQGHLQGCNCNLCKICRGEL